MKPFSVVRSIFTYTGYFKNEKNSGQFPLNHVLSLIFWAGTWYYSLPALLYFLFIAETFLEFSESFYFLVDGFLFVAVWPIFLYLKSEFIQLIEDFDNLIKKRN